MSRFYIVKRGSRRKADLDRFSSLHLNQYIFNSAGMCHILTKRGVCNEVKVEEYTKYLLSYADKRHNIVNTIASLSFADVDRGDKPVITCSGGNNVHLFALAVAEALDRFYVIRTIGP